MEINTPDEQLKYRLGQVDTGDVRKSSAARAYLFGHCSKTWEWAISEHSLRGLTNYPTISAKEILFEIDSLVSNLNMGKDCLQILFSGFINSKKIYKIEKNTMEAFFTVKEGEEINQIIIL